jgi:hypothetical protein
MAAGGGKYDEECTEIREKTQSKGVLLIVIDGIKGGGFSAQMTPEHMAKMPGVLRIVAEQIERDMQNPETLSNAEPEEEEKVDVGSAEIEASP